MDEIWLCGKCQRQWKSETEKRAEEINKKTVHSVSVIIIIMMQADCALVSKWNDFLFRSFDQNDRTKYSLFFCMHKLINWPLNVRTLFHTHTHTHTHCGCRVPTNQAYSRYLLLKLNTLTVIQCEVAWRCFHSLFSFSALHLSIGTVKWMEWHFILILFYFSGESAQKQKRPTTTEPFTNRSKLAAHFILFFL